MSALNLQLLQDNPLPPNKAVHVITKAPSQITVNDLVNEATPTGREGFALIEAVVGEPYFATSLLPWHNLHCWYGSNALRSVCTPDCVVLPARAELMAIAGTCTRDLYTVHGCIHITSFVLHHLHYIITITSARLGLARLRMLMM